MKRYPVFVPIVLCFLFAVSTLCAATGSGEVIVDAIKMLHRVSSGFKKAYTPPGPVETLIAEMRRESMGAKTPDESDLVMKKYQTKGEDLYKELKRVEDRLALDKFLWTLAINVGDDTRIEALIDRQAEADKDEMLLMTGDFSRQRGKTLSANLTARLQKLADGPQSGAAERAKKLLNPTPAPTEGKPFPAFPGNLKTVDDQPLTLERFKGKILLVDCWATWCGPCRKEIPNLVAAYKKFQAKGFEIIGISFDQEKDKLDAFTKENGMTWPQYFDGKGWENIIGQSLEINSIPAMFLLDREGNLISKDLRGEKLEAKLAELLKE